MVDTFSVGEVAEIIADLDGGAPAAVGLECTIIRGLHSFFPYPEAKMPPGTPVYEVHASNLRVYFCRPEELRKKRLPPPALDFTAGNWDLCPWQPAKEKV